MTGWASKTPDSFVFSFKVPQAITHEKVLVGCDPEFQQFVDTVSLLGGKLGPMVLQFPWFGRDIFKDQSQFLDHPVPQKTSTGLQIRGGDS